MVFSEQRIFGLLVMIEQNLFPIPLGMAAFTLGAKAPFVFVVLLVA